MVISSLVNQAELSMKTSAADTHTLRERERVCFFIRMTIISPIM